MKREPRSRVSAALLHIGALLVLVATAPAAVAASSATSIQVIPVNGTANIGITGGYPTDAVRVRYALVQGQDATDGFVDGDTVSIQPGGAANRLRIGATPGIRVVRYCYENTGVNCNPANGDEYFHIGGVDATCSLTAPNTSGNAPLNVAATAQCTVQAGAGIILTGGNYNWSLPMGVTALPPTSPTAPATASFTLNNAGNYNVGIAPVLDFSIARGAPFNTTDPAGAIAPVPANLPLQVIAAANQAPTAAITGPPDNQQFGDAATIPIRANATDPDGTITQVEFLLDGNPIGTDNAAPYALDWRVNATPGSHVLVVRATDNQGAVAESAPVRINIVRQVQAIDVLTPYANLKFLPGGTVDVRFVVRGGLGTAPDVDLDWTLTGGATTAAGTCTANDTPNHGTLRTNASGEAVVHFVASCADNARALVVTSRTTPPVTTTVRLRGPHDAQLVLTAPREGASYDEADAFDLRATLVDPDSRVRQVEFTANGEVIGTDATAPYAMQWPANKPPGSYRVAVRGREATGVLIEGDTANITITRRTGSLQIVTAGTALNFTPGQLVTVRVRANSPQGPAANQQLTFAIEGAAPSPAPANAPAQRSGAAQTTASTACAPNDSPAQGLVTTDANGEADVIFTAGCNSGSRRLTVASTLDPSVSATVTLRGPDANATALRPGIDARAIVAMPGEPTPVPVTVSSDTGQPLAGATLEFTLQPATAGSITALATADAQGHASATLTLGAGDAAASVHICVSGRPDLCADVPVRSATLAVIRPAAELTAPILRQSIDTARVQLGQVRSHLSTSRSASGHGFSGGLNVRVGDGSVPLGGRGDGTDEERYRFFIAGDVDVGERDSRGRARDGFKVTTRGVTAGVDYRFAPDFVAGAALGAMRAATDLANGGSQDATGASLSLFAQWLPTERWYLNAIVNVGRNNYDIERRLYDGSRLDSDTSSRQRAAQFEAGYSFGRNALKFTPFLRYEIVHADVDPIREPGGSLDALEISGIRVKANTLSAGAYFEYAFSARNGVWIPSLRMEYFGENRDQEEMFARLIAGNAGTFRVPDDETDDNYGSVGLNLQWLTGTRGQPISSFISIDRGFGRDDYETTRYAIGIKIPF